MDLGRCYHPLVIDTQISGSRIALVIEVSNPVTVRLDRELIALDWKTGGVVSDFIPWEIGPDQISEPRCFDTRLRARVATGRPPLSPLHTSWRNTGCSPCVTGAPLLNCLFSTRFYRGMIRGICKFSASPHFPALPTTPSSLDTKSRPRSFLNSRWTQLKAYW